MTPPVFRVGLVGGGGISMTHARAAAAIPRVRIAAVQGANADKVGAVCAAFGGTAYAGFESFLAHRPMDFVVIGSPSGLHAEQGIAAARQGLHVLVEKPIDISTTRADALVDAAEQANVRLGVIFQDRFKPDMIALKRLVDDGTLGRPLLVDARVPWYRPPDYYSASRWRGTRTLDGGGALINQAIHTLDLLVWLLGDVARVQARTATLLHRIETEDSGAAILEFACGALGVFAFTTAAFPGYPRRVELTGTAGTAILQGDTLERVEVRDGGAREPADARPTTAGATGGDERASSPLVGDAGAHQAVFEDFTEAMREGRPPRCDGRQGRRTLALVEAIYEASKRARPLVVGP
jgi:UDP-N-acetyl-2-amino-2-deoxyglucuronate dehydrogenase